MTQKVSKKVDHLIPSGIRKVNEKALAMEREGISVIHLEIGRPDFSTPDYIKEAAKESLDKNNVFYTSNFGDMALRKEIAEKLAKENGLNYCAEEILVTVGLSEAIYCALTVLLEEDDEILVPDPIWMNYLNVPYLLGAKPVTYELSEEKKYQIDLEEVERKITDRTKIIVINTPHNPTGSVLEYKTLQGLADLAIRHDLIVLSDEVYERIMFDGKKHISIAEFPGMKERTITLNGFSKAYSMTGWRLGYMAAPKEIIQVMNKIHQIVTICAPSFVQEAAVSALKEEKKEVADMVNEYKERRDYMVEAINRIKGMSCLKPQGAFYIFVNIKGLGMNSEEAANFFLEKAQVAMVPGTVFGAKGEGYIRLSYANSLDNLKIAVSRIEKALEERKS